MLKEVNKKQRLVILKNAPNTLFKVLDIIFKHCISGVIPLDIKKREKCKTLLKGKRNKSAIKARLTQDGGAFPLILSGLIPIIGSLLTNIL